MVDELEKGHHVIRTFKRLLQSLVKADLVLSRVQ